ncbi:MAG: hypothetical protein XU13_C0020G0002 [Candidatus Rokubacteria bacterium CSP1-6]|nr:MAG: hypothetical protein XU13_C0020G0002 [Candidatus Rokubacteria bacterium CSP1-6]
MALVGTAVVLLLVGPLLVIGAVGLLVLAAAIFSGSPRRLRETFECPVTGKVVTAEFLVPEGAKHPAEVASCTTFPNRARIACKKDCRRFADVRWGLSRAVFPRWALTANGTVTWRTPAERPAA